MTHVFLGGTCNDSTWRDELIPMLKCTYFNPVVDDWNESCIQREYEEKELANYQLYVITPEATGCFSIAELIHASSTGKALCMILGSWDTIEDQRRYKSFNECLKLAEKNGAIRFYSLQECADFLNTRGINYG